jgi:cardiolipin synthase
VGSTNLDWRSFLDNDEVNAVVIGREFAGQMEAMFEKDLASSLRITPQAWADRPLKFKLKEWLAQFWRRLL